MLLWELLFPPVCPLCGKPYRGRSKERTDDICPTCRLADPVIKGPHCHSCGKPLHASTSGEWLCHDCRKYTHSFDEGRALYVHRGAPRQAVYDLKFANRRVNARIFGRELADHFSGWLQERNVKLIVPVPLHKRRLRERGYNQAALIARALSEETGIPVSEDVIRRVHATERLKDLDRTKRRAAVEGVFEADLSGVSSEMRQSIVIIDDIFTTGSTIDAVARVCKDAGAQKVYFLTVTIGEGL